jgi:hypothetical protein
MKVMDLDGSAYERGYQQGKQLKDQYEKMIDVFLNSELFRENKPGPVPNFVVKWFIGMLGSTRTKKAVKQHLPNQFERVVGLGEGLGANRNFIWGIQYLEIMFCEAGKSIKAPGPAGCTQLHATALATAEGKPRSGRNYDFPNMLSPFQIVRRETPSEKNRLATTTATQVPLAGTHQGINEAGLMIAANNARLWKGPEFNEHGVPYMFIIMEMLETCRTVAEAVEFISKFPARANTGFLGMMDAGGDCALVEFTAVRHAVRRPDESGVLAQTNHYHAMKDANLPDGTYWTVKGMEGLEYAASTKARFATADRLLHESAGKITVETLKTILRNHDGMAAGTDNTVCCHGLTGGTLSSLIFEIADRTLWIAEGAPCENDYMKVPFRDKKK